MTHVFFDSDTVDWSAYLRQQQRGEGVMMGGRVDELDPDKPSPVFRGTKYMRGYGVKGALSSIGRFLLPVARNLMESAKDEASLTLGRIGADMARGKPIGQTFKQHALTGVQNLGTRVQQCGKGKKPNKKKQILKGLSLAEISGDQVSDPIVSGPNPLPPTRKRNRKKDYLDL